MSTLTSPCKAEHTPGETGPVITDSRGTEEETNEPQPDSQSPSIYPPSTSSPTPGPGPMTTQAAPVDVTVVAPEAKKISLDHCPNLGIPADSEPQRENQQVQFTNVYVLVAS